MEDRRVVRSRAWSQFHESRPGATVVLADVVAAGLRSPELAPRSDRRPIHRPCLSLAFIGGLPYRLMQGTERSHDRIQAAALVGVITTVSMAGVIAIAWGVGTLVGARFEELSRDASAVLGGPPWTGHLSLLMASLWFASAVIALFAGVVLRRIGHGSAPMLLAGGLLTAAMAVDDLFLLHEAVYLQIGIPEAAVFGAYGLAVVAFVVRFRLQLTGSALLIGSAMLMWAVSAVIDLASGTESYSVVEDGAKSIGVALWSVMLVRLTYTEITAAVPDRLRTR